MGRGFPDFDELPTRLHGDTHADRTVVDLEEPEPTIPPEPPPDVAPPRYQCERLLGQGTFGRVYAARDTRLGRLVALKILNREYVTGGEIRQRFIQEAHAAACIPHPGIVTVYDVGELEDGVPYIAMELLPGESLHARLVRLGPLPSPAVKEIGRQVASALHAAHCAGVIHRDLKPENILLVPDPAAIGGERVKVLDFGLAKSLLATAGVKTQAATVFGTPAYMSPEQCASTRDIDNRSDIYALGCVLFHVATGRPPFEGTLRELVTKHRTAPPPSTRASAPEVEPELDTLIQAMLAKLPDDRPATMAEIVGALTPRPPEPARSGLLRGLRSLWS